MTYKIINGKVISGNEIAEKNVYFKDGKIVAVTSDNLPFDKEIDACGKYVSAGFIDIHVHGGAGYEFVDATKESIVIPCNMHVKHGTTTIFPTLSAYSYDKIVTSLSTMKKYIADEDILPNVGGIHMEGPYFSPKQCGAQNPDEIRKPIKSEYDALIANYGDIIKRWSYAPERDDGQEFLKALNKAGIVAAAGHTDAEYDEMMPAYELGCKLITHLYSCTSTIVRKGGFRHLGIIETAYLYDDIFTETIADGKHMPPQLLKMIFKIKGNNAMCLVTDSIRYGGLTQEDVEKGNFKKENYIIEDGIAKLPDKSAFAGSIATTDVLVRTCVKNAGIPLCDAVRMITKVPAEIMKLNTKGSLKENFDADIVIFDENIIMDTVIVGGKIVHKA
ncbi:MAG: N-acetylglucosamine-6-phosphate deacetylase [Clostridia bacterium]|nr:N-acetylglucosamine-6-phosphate deacetylase [Clostridia bacterium]